MSIAAEIHGRAIRRSPSARNHDPWVLAVIFALALGLRALALHHYHFIGADGGVDGVVLAVSGKNLFSGEGLSFQGRPETIHAPLYPILTGAAWRLLGDLELAGQIVSVLAGALLVIPVFLLARELYGRRTGLIAAALTAVFPAFLYASTEVRLASLYALLCSFTAWLIFRNALAPGFRRGAEAGAGIALCYLARPEAILFLPLAALLPFLRGKIRGRLGSRRDAAPTTEDREGFRVEFVGGASRPDPGRLGSRQECRSHEHDARANEKVAVGGASLPAPITITCIKKSGPRSKLAPLAYLAGIALGFAILSSPYWVFLKRHLGYWTLNGRGPFTFVGYFQDDWDRAYFDLYTYPDAARREWLARGGMTGFLEENLVRAAKRLARNTCSLARLGSSPQISRLGIPPSLVNAAVIALAAGAIAGGALQVRRRRWLFRDTFLALFLATVLPYLMLTWRDLRYFYPYFPVLIVLAAEGCRRWADRVSGAERPAEIFRAPLAAAPAVLLFGAMLALSAALIPAKIRTVPGEYKLLGLWMRANLPDLSASVVLSRKLGVAFYAGSRHALIHPGSYAEAVGFAREIGARYLVVDDWTTPAFRPALSFLLSDTPPPEELERVHALVHDGRRIVLYRFTTAPGL